MGCTLGKRRDSPPSYNVVQILLPHEWSPKRRPGHSSSLLVNPLLGSKDVIKENALIVDFLLGHQST